MMKIVPASRLVTEASLEPPTRLPSIDRRRAVTPAGEAVAGWVSTTAKAAIPGAAGGGDGPMYQRIVKNGLGGAPPLSSPHRGRGDGGSVQLDIKLVSPVAADQRQFQRSAFRVCARRQAVELEGEALHAGR